MAVEKLESLEKKDREGEPANHRLTKLGGSAVCRLFVTL